MPKKVVLLLFSVLVPCCWLTSAQSNPAASTRVPSRLPPGFMDRWKKEPRSKKFSNLSIITRGRILSGAIGSDPHSFKTWQGSFNYQGVRYPYTMVGNPPPRGGETHLDTSIIFLNFKFEEFVDPKGNNIIIDSSSIVQDVLGSPNFVATEYTDGSGQFGDAVQRASFFNVAGHNWHTTLRPPRILKPVTILVPFGQAEVFDTNGNGEFVGIVNGDFLASQFLTILQLEDISTRELVMLVSGNVFGDTFLGFHFGIEVGSAANPSIQTFLYVSWLNEDIAGPIFADATSLTHEVSEWISDPFGTNVVPEYVIPNSGGLCQNLLEVGDAIEFLDNSMAPVTVNGHLYHTQVEALLPWFSREAPSSAFEGVYSYPDTSVLLAPSDPCPTP